MRNHYSILGLLLALGASGVLAQQPVKPGAGVSVDGDLGTDPKKIVFTPTNAGKYPIYCSKKLPFVAGHRAKGMEGVLELVP